MTTDLLQRRAFRFLSDADAMNLPAAEWIVDRIIPNKGFTILYGPPASLKTFLSLDLSWRVALGESWLGFPVRQGNVIYILAEGSYVYATRARAWKATTQINALPGMYVVLDAVNLGIDVEVSRFIKQASPIEPSLIIVDTLSRSMPGLDENLAGDMTKVVRNVDRFREELDAAVLVVHHSGKTNTRTERGSSVLKGAADCAISLTQKDSVVTMSCEKQRNASPFEDIKLKLQIVKLPDDQESAVITRSDRPSDQVTATKLTENENQILEAMRANPSLTKPADIASATDIPARTLSRWLGALAEKGLVEPRGRTSNRTYHLINNVVKGNFGQDQTSAKLTPRPKPNNFSQAGPPFRGPAVLAEDRKMAHDPLRKDPNGNSQLIPIWWHVPSREEVEVVVKRLASSLGKDPDEGQVQAVLRQRIIKNKRREPDLETKQIEGQAHCLASWFVAKHGSLQSIPSFQCGERN